MRQKEYILAFVPQNQRLPEAGDTDSISYKS